MPLLHKLTSHVSRKTKFKPIDFQTRIFLAVFWSDEGINRTTNSLSDILEHFVKQHQFSLTNSFTLISYSISGGFGRKVGSRKWTHLSFYLLLNYARGFFSSRSTNIFTNFIQLNCLTKYIIFLIKYGFLAKTDVEEW